MAWASHAAAFQQQQHQTRVHATFQQQNRPVPSLSPAPSLQSGSWTDSDTVLLTLRGGVALGCTASIWDLLVLTLNNSERGWAVMYVYNVLHASSSCLWALPCLTMKARKIPQLTKLYTVTSVPHAYKLKSAEVKQHSRTHLFCLFLFSSHSFDSDLSVWVCIIKLTVTMLAVIFTYQ